jgi:hypothetical protein
MHFVPYRMLKLVAFLLEKPHVSTFQEEASFNEQKNEQQLLKYAFMNPECNAVNIEIKQVYMYRKDETWNMHNSPDA